MSFRLPTALAFASFAMLRSAAAHAGDAGCKPLLDAFARQLDTPFHESISGRGRTTEKIVLADATFVKMPNGRWVKNPTTAQERGEQLNATRATTSNCKFVGRETVDGQTATIYSGHLGGGEMRYWIGQNGLPLKGEGGTGPARVTWTFAYDHVEAPQAN